MVFKRRVVAPIAFAWTLTAAGLAAFTLAAAPASMAELEDIQIGERGNQTRIAFLCSVDCVLEARGDDFLLKNIHASFDLNLAQRSKRVENVRAISGEGGAVISLTANAVVENVEIKACNVGGRPATCLDLFFGPGGARAEPAPQGATPAPDLAEKTAAEIAAPPGVPAGVKPELRETASDRLSQFAGLAAPERIDSPAGAVLATVRSMENAVAPGKPTLRIEEKFTEPVERIFVSRIGAILEKDLTPAFCNNAEAALQADAWALGAMVDVGLCTAARGDLEEADAVLARLLEFTPDNYEALVGRAIIAEQANEKGVARKYYQDALNALPPLAESNRIENAMAALE